MKEINKMKEKQEEMMRRRKGNMKKHKGQI